MRRASGLMIVMLIPGSAFAQDLVPPSAAIDPPAPVVPRAPEGVLDATAFDLAELPEAPAPVPVRGDCTAPETLPGDDPGIVVCGRRARDYASVSQSYDKGGWAEPPPPPADPTTLTTGSCLDITCVRSPAVNGNSLLDGLYKLGKAILDDE